jgi:hypothetical protein
VAHESRHRLGQGWDDAPDDGVFYRLWPYCVHREERPKLHRIFVGRATARRLDPKLLDELVTLEKAVDNVGVADVDRQEHRVLSD